MVNITNTGSLERERMEREQHVATSLQAAFSKSLTAYRAARECFSVLDSFFPHGAELSFDR